VLLLLQVNLSAVSTDNVLVPMKRLVGDRAVQSARTRHLLPGTPDKTARTLNPATDSWV